MPQTHAEESAQYNELLKRLPGVYAANVRLDEGGLICEVHLLSGSSRNAKQTVRDARSALLAAYGKDVEYQKFSVAQISEPLGGEIEAPCGGVRLRGSQLEQSIADNRYSVKVALEYRGQSFEGSAVSSSTAVARQRAVAEAVIGALHDYLGDGRMIFSLMGVQKINSLPVPVFVALLECIENGVATLLVGAAQAGENEAIGIERATLDAVNRKLAIMKQT